MLLAKESTCSLCHCFKLSKERGPRRQNPRISHRSNCCNNNHAEAERNYIVSSEVLPRTGAATIMQELSVIAMFVTGID